MCIGRNGVVIIGEHILESESTAWLPGRVLELGLVACSGITHLPEFITFASSHLQSCKLRYCDDMEWIITSGWSTFPNLECLQIDGLSKLNNLCKGIPEEGTLANLLVLRVHACNGLRTFLSIVLVKNLKNLEEIVIEDCKRVEEIIGDGTGNEEWTVILPRLCKLRLSSLPKLISIYSEVMICDSLSTIEVLECPELKTLPFFMEIRVALIHSLKQIKGSRKWCEELKKSYPDCIRLLHSLFREEPQSSATYLNFEADWHSNASSNSSFGPR
ncbi:hypothetical protein ACH5RR_028866 [Cinchona calisaya]|uniref:Disease resistance protein At4g27190-like leucine-rich repeats domain-containing protein n=1 Tax=Cinchona calisaya TaxID=153742 RepID=A0ABD2YQ06_9GENT